MSCGKVIVLVFVVCVGVVQQSHGLPSLVDIMGALNPVLESAGTVDKVKKAAIAGFKQVLVTKRGPETMEDRILSPVRAVINKVSGDMDRFITDHGDNDKLKECLNGVQEQLKQAEDKLTAGYKVCEGIQLDMALGFIKGYNYIEPKEMEKIMKLPDEYRLCRLALIATPDLTKDCNQYYSGATDEVDRILKILSPSFKGETEEVGFHTRLETCSEPIIEACEITLSYIRTQVRECFKSSPYWPLKMNR